MGWSQAKVSRLERGRNAAQPDDVVAWARATGASPDQVTRLRERAEQALVEVAIYRGRALPDLARGVASLERVTGVLRSFNGVAIPGLLQTEAYARAMFATGERDAAAVAAGVAARVERAGVLLEARHRFEFVIGEAALRWRFGPVEAIAEQVERLRVVASLPNVELGILPTDIEGPVWHWLPFTLFDQRLDDGDPVVLVETLSTSLRESDPAAVEQYRRVFERVRQVARYGEEGFVLLRPPPSRSYLTSD